MRARRAILSASLLVGVLAGAPGCAQGHRSAEASSLFASYRFPRSREALRPWANRRPLHEDSLLALSQLGMAALADGDTFEATRTLRESYELIESARINDPARAAASTLLSDKHRVWKGEPGEQAMTMYAFGVASALAGNWEDARVGARAAARRLRDYAEQSSGAEIDTEFTNAYLLEAIAERVIGSSGAAPDLATRADPTAEAIAGAIATQSFNTVVFLDAGMGPVKEAFGGNDAETGWFSREPALDAPLAVWFDGSPVGVSSPALDVNALVGRHRHDPLLDERRTRGALGDAALLGGAVVIGSRSDSSTNALVGLGVIAAGLLAKSGAQADTRFNALLPASASIAVMSLPEHAAPLVVELRGHPASRVVLPEFAPGTPDDPAVVYLRLPDVVASPEFLRAETVSYSNDAHQPVAGDFPWILGGACVATPTPHVLETYQAGGYLAGMSLDDLRRLYALEGIHIGVGPVDDPLDPEPGLYRHILEGGDALFTPHVGTVAYKRIMCSPHTPYRARSPEVAALQQQYSASHAEPTHGVSP